MAQGPELAQDGSMKDLRLNCGELELCVADFPASAQNLSDDDARGFPVGLEDLLDPLQKGPDLGLFDRFGPPVAWRVAIGQNLLQGLPVHAALAKNLPPGDTLN